VRERRKKKTTKGEQPRETFFFCEPATTATLHSTTDIARITLGGGGGGVHHRQGVVKTPLNLMKIPPSFAFAFALNLALALAPRPFILCYFILAPLLRVRRQRPRVRSGVPCPWGGLWPWLRLRRSLPPPPPLYSRGFRPPRSSLRSSAPREANGGLGLPRHQRALPGQRRLRRRLRRRRRPQGREQPSCR